MSILKNDYSFSQSLSGEHTFTIMLIVKNHVRFEKKVYKPFAFPFEVKACTFVTPLPPVHLRYEESCRVISQFRPSPHVMGTNYQPELKTN